MPKGKEIVINAEPIIALVAALSDLSILHSLYRRVLIPYEACQEIQAGRPNRFGATELHNVELLKDVVFKVFDIEKE